MILAEGWGCRAAVSKNWPSGSTRAWRTVRAEVLDANGVTNGGRCRLAIPGICTEWATQVHHTVDRAVVGDDPAYLLAACRECNVRVGEPSETPDPDPYEWTW